MSNRTTHSIPSWLEEPPQQVVIAPPVQSKIQTLPFDQLTWENFERLCLRLVRAEAKVQHCQLYGERGDNQDGIDIYARKQNGTKCSVYQCKREKDFGPNKIESAVDKFWDGNWLEQSDVFVLCTQESLNSKARADEFKRQSERLATRGISFLRWDKEELSAKLKNCPDIVEDFFSKPWTDAFCNRSQLTQPTDKAREIETIRGYMQWLLKTTSHFSVPTLSRQFSITDDWIFRKVRCVGSKDSTPFYLNYISELYKRCVILGDSGSGKSLAMKWLANHLAKAGQTVILVRLPDVMRLLSSGMTFDDAVLASSTDGLKTDRSLLETTLHSVNYLLADGLDECDFERADIAEKLKSWAEGHSETKVVISTRKGYEAESLAQWTQVELQPLDEKSALELAKKLLCGILADEVQLKRATSSIENAFQNRKMVSFISTSPLFISFLVCLASSGVEVKGNRRTELYQKIIDLSYRHTPQSRKSFSINRLKAKRVLIIIGWKLMHRPSLTEDELFEETVRELAISSCSASEAESEVEEGIRFWETKRILSRSYMAHESHIGFVHYSLCEYTAGCYASRLEKFDLEKWLTEVVYEVKWKETIRFASGLGMGEKIATFLLDLDKMGENLLTDLQLIASVIEEAQNISPQLIDALANKAQSKLLSADPNIVSDAVNLLLPVLLKYPSSTASIVESLTKSKELWPRVGSMRISLAVSAESVCLNRLVSLIEEILKDWESNTPCSTNKMGRFGMM